MTRYIVGIESHLNVTEVEPKVIPTSSPGNTSRGKKVTQVLWPHSSFVGGRFAFALKRGVVEEFRTWDYGDGKTERVFARVFPDDATPDLDALDAKIAETEAEWKRLKQERCDMLAAIVVRAERVKVKA